MKTKRYLKRFFNMIEISLALGVTSVGVLGAVTILPIALKTSSATTYNAYLSDAANMVFMGLDEYLNETCYALDYEKEHTPGISAEDLQDIYKDRREAFRDIFPSNTDGAVTLNNGLKKRLKSGSSTGVQVLHKTQKNHGLIAFYSSTPPSPGDLPEDFTEFYSENIGRPIFAARYRIVVTDLENDSQYKMDGLRKLVEVQTEMTTLEWVDSRTGKKEKISVPGARVAGTQRCNLTDDEKKIMKRVYIEFSWPAHAEYKARTKKTFVKEIYMLD